MDYKARMEAYSIYSFSNLPDEVVLQSDKER